MVSTGVRMMVPFCVTVVLQEMVDIEKHWLVSVSNNYIYLLNKFSKRIF